MALIDADIGEGRVSRTVSSFSALHDHVDANGYCEAAGVPFLKGADDPYLIINQVEAEVSRRLLARSPLCEGCYKPLHGTPSPCAECAANAW
jgi:hypothetical protein